MPPRILLCSSRLGRLQLDRPGQGAQQRATIALPCSAVLAYHLVHTIRFQLKAAGIHLSWEGIRRALAGQDRVTVTLKRADGKTVHIRKATRAEPRQQVIYDALGISDRPGRAEKTIA
jgi:hypothetical protein